MNDELKNAFTKLFDDSDYRPDPIGLEGMEAYLRKESKNSCPYTDEKSKKLWEHGWDATDVGHFKAAEFGGAIYGDTYDDPKNWK